MLKIYCLLLILKKVLLLSSYNIYLKISFFFKKVDNIEKFKSFKNIYLSLKYLFNFKLLFGKKLRVL